MPTTTPTRRRFTFLTFIGMLLVGLGVLRASLFVAHDPAFGYGEPAGQRHIAACVGLIPLSAEAKSGELARPHAYYQTAAIDPAGCYFGTEVLLAVPVVLAYRIAFLVGHDPEILMPIQAFGIFKLFLFVLLASLVALALAPHPYASLVHGVLFFLVVADPVATLWLNALSGESAALLGAYAAIAMFAVILLRGAALRWPWWALGAGLLALGFARAQFALLPLALAAIAMPALRARSRRSAWTLIGLAAVVAVVQVAIAPLRPEANAVDRANAYLGAILPASKDEQRTLGRIGVPPRCAVMSGSAWWARRGESAEPVCPEVGELSPFAFVALLAGEPRTVVGAVSRVIPATQSMVPGYLGISAGAAVRSIADLPPWAMSFVAMLGKVPSMVYATVVMALLLAFPMVVLWMLWTVWKDPPVSATLPTVYASLGAILAYTLAVSAFGSGVVAAERHHWLGSLATLVMVLLLPGVIWQLWADFLRARIALAAGLGVLLLATGWLAWTRGQPMAIGHADSMVEGPGRVLEVGGWALDPWEVRRVYATVGGGHPGEATRGIERRDLEFTYPGYPSPSKGGFKISIPSNAWRENELMRVFVENRAGGITEIDRRLVRPRP